MANINVDLPEELHKELRVNSVKEDTTLKDFIINSLQEEVDDQ